MGVSLLSRPPNSWICHLPTYSSTISSSTHPPSHLLLTFPSSTHLLTYLPALLCIHASMHPHASTHSCIHPFCSLSTHLSIHPPTHLLLTYPSSTHLLICLPAHPSICSSIHPTAHPLIYPSMLSHLSITQSFTIQSLVTHPPTHPSFYLSADPLPHLSTFLFVYSSTQPSPMSRKKKRCTYIPIYHLPIVRKGGVFLFLFSLFRFLFSPPNPTP